MPSLLCFKIPLPDTYEIETLRVSQKETRISALIFTEVKADCTIMISEIKNLAEMLLKCHREDV